MVTLTALDDSDSTSSTHGFSSESIILTQFVLTAMLIMVFHEPGLVPLVQQSG